MNPVAVCVGIPTYARGDRLVHTLRRVMECSPPPSEVIVHIDQSDGLLEKTLIEEFPLVRVLSTQGRVGPGGGRHRCALATSQPYFVSFDDDSWPLDSDFFAEVVRIFSAYPSAALVAATIFHPHESEPAREEKIDEVLNYTGCGYGLRLSAYSTIAGNVDRPWAYGIEEVDVALQFHAADWELLRSASLRVFHDTQLAHHPRPEIVASNLQNVALLAYLRYPIMLWPRALLQVANLLIFDIRNKRFKGLFSGLAGIPVVLYSFRRERFPLSFAKVRSFLRLRRASTVKKASKLP